MRLGVVGNGVVGQATARAFLEHVEEVRVYDVIAERRTHTLDAVLDCDLVMVCLPTPQKKDSLECDTSVVEDFCNMLGGSAPHGNYVIRSTVPIGFTKRMREQYRLPNLCHSPEFLTARCALVDAQIPSRNVVGHGRPLTLPRSDLERNEQMRCSSTLISLYKKRWPHVPVHVLSSDESEAVKLFQNSFFAVKVAFWNECRVLADKLGLDWQRVMNAILADGRISPAHTAVPGPDGKFGFGGTCLPKDLANLVHTMQSGAEAGEFEAYPLVMNAALQRNKLDRERTP